MKTFKRELAVVMFLWLGYVVETKDVQTVEALVWPVFGYIAAAFGFDAYGKQLQRNPSQPTNRRGAERSSEHPNREREYPSLDDK